MCKEEPEQANYSDEGFFNELIEAIAILLVENDVDGEGWR